MTGITGSRLNDIINTTINDISSVNTYTGSHSVEQFSTVEPQPNIETFPADDSDKDFLCLI